MMTLVFPVDAEWYGVDMRSVREVAAAPAVTPLPTAPPHVLGVFNLRGEIIPLFDAVAALGLGSGRVLSFAVVTETALGPAGLCATDVPECAELGAAVVGSESPGVLGVHALDRRLVTVLDVEAVLAPLGEGS